MSAEEARAEAQRRYPLRLSDSARVRTHASAARYDFVQGAVWQASRPVTDEEALAAANAYMGYEPTHNDPDAFSPALLADIRAALEAAAKVRAGR